MPQYRVSAKAIIKDDQDRLLVNMGDAGLYSLPGGGWEYEETLEECIRREIMEELGVEITHLSKVKLMYKGLLQTNGIWKISMLMPATLSSHDFRFSDNVDEETQTARFVTREEIATLTFYSDEMPLLDHLDEIWP